jgi:DNA-directed RNA polymerase sigma subunit (sigma70/sigma32)
MDTDYQRQMKEYARRKAAMIRLRAQGWTLQRIADKYGIKRQRVGQIVGSAK